MEDEYYKILGVRKGMPMAEIKKEYRKLAMKYHPDHNVGNDSAEKKFSEITMAFREIEIEARKYPDNFGIRVNYYDVLGVDMDASLEEINASYRAKVKDCEDDRGMSRTEMDERLHLINSAYDLLASSKEKVDPDDW